MLHPIFQWFDEMRIAVAIRDSRLLFPIIENVHILALAVLLGTVVILSMRMLGFGLKQRPAADLYRTLAGLRNGALAVILASGFLLFSSEALKCYDSPPFWAKMCTLGAAILFQYTFVRASAKRGVWMKPAGLFSLLLWFGVGAAGRAIGFY
jgi:hypothetical protein